MDYSTFDLSQTHKTTFDMGYLVPVFIKPTLPGDYIKSDVDMLVRTMPTIAPILDDVDIKINHFYVPSRVLWNKFGDWYAQSDTYKVLNPSAKPKIPFCKVPINPVTGQAPYRQGRLADYLGIPSTLTDSNLIINALPFLAYQRIFLDYYAPQRWVQYLNNSNNVHWMAELNKILEQIKVSDAADLGYLDEVSNNSYKRLFQMRKVGWNHDYFTNALPTPSLFDDVKLPQFNEDVAENFKFFTSDGSQMYFNANTANGIANINKLPTVRNLRESIAMQQYLEKMQHGGGRYMETMQLIWKQDLKNRELQRSQYLGGDVVPLFVNEVEQTAQTSEGNLGDLGGKGIGVGKANGAKFEADEFGYYIVMAHVVPKRSYQHTLDRMYLVDDPLDLPNPMFEGIGDQAVLNYELNGNDATVFGYVPRYSDYKGSIDRFSGEMKNSLKHWHLGEVLSLPMISPEFIECTPREDIFRVNEPDKILGTFKLNCTVKRKLSANSNSGLSRI